MLFSTEIYDAITFHIENAVLDQANQSVADALHMRYAIDGIRCRRTLANLRLVNKAFCRSASPRLFRHIVAAMLHNSPKSSSPLSKLLGISESVYAADVRQIDLGVQAHGDKIPCYTQCTSYVEDLAGLLASCLPKFPNLSAISIHESDLFLPPEDIKSFVDTVVRALRYIPLPNLTELEVLLPDTSYLKHWIDDMPSSLRIPIDRVLGSLRYLKFTDTSVLDCLGDEDFGDESPIFSTRKNYEAPLCKLVRLMTGLESLSIHSCEVLRLDSVEFPPHLCLKYLDLSGVTISSHNLLSLVEPSKETLEHIRFQLDLTSGLWQHVLLRVSELHYLLDFHVFGISYADTEESLRNEWRFNDYDNNEIMTENPLDFNALGNVQRRVNVNRVVAGIPEVPEDEFQYLEMDSLEMAIEKASLAGEGSD